MNCDNPNDSIRRWHLNDGRMANRADPEQFNLPLQSTLHKQVCLNTKDFCGNEDNNFINIEFSKVGKESSYPKKSIHGDLNALCNSFYAFIYSKSVGPLFGTYEVVS